MGGPRSVEGIGPTCLCVFVGVCMCERIKEIKDERCVILSYQQLQVRVLQ